MAFALLGPHFDIHGGGLDLQFPHHENEIAQSCAACDAPFARVWMHNGFVRINEEKMSKSLGNFFTVREVLPRLRPEVLRAFLLSSHYRGPINYGEDNLRQADAALTRLYLALRGVKRPRKPEAPAATAKFKAAMDDDFNTPEALAVLQGLARDVNVAKTAGDLARAGALAAELVQLGGHLGLLERKPEEWLATRSELTGPAAQEAGLEDAEVERLVAARVAARKAKTHWKPTATGINGRGLAPGSWPAPPGRAGGGARRAPQSLFSARAGAPPLPAYCASGWRPSSGRRRPAPA
jgi:cysteinyl-tRNA synthetase